MINIKSFTGSLPEAPHPPQEYFWPIVIWHNIGFYTILPRKVSMKGAHTDPLSGVISTFRMDGFGAS